MSADWVLAGRAKRGMRRGTVRPGVVIVLVVIAGVGAWMGIHAMMKSLPNGTTDTSWTPPAPPVVPAAPAPMPSGGPGRVGGNGPGNVAPGGVAPVRRVGARPAPQPEKLMELVALDGATGNTLEGVLVQSIGARNRFRGLTDDGGRALVSIPARLQGSFEINLRDKGYVEEEYVWTAGGGRLGGAIPAMLTVKMERTVAVGGKVIDDAGQPVAGATVVLGFDKTYADPHEVADFRRRDPMPAIVTAGDGTWTFADAPPGCSGIRMAAWDYRHVFDDQSAMKSYTPVSQLYDGTSRYTLQRGVALNGAVRDERGNPVAGAEVSLGTNRWRRGGGFAVPDQFTDAEGQFSYAFSGGDHAVITVQALGYAPELKTVVIGAQAQNLMIELADARQMTGRVVDPLGRPVHADLSVESWRGYQTINGDFDTDRAGRFVWTQAPADKVYFSARANGQLSADGQALAAGKDNLIRLSAAGQDNGFIIRSDGTILNSPAAVVSDVLPDVEYKTLDGKDGKLSDFRGKYALVQFWSPVSSQSQQQIPWMKSVYGTYGKDDRMTVIGLAFAPSAAMVGQFAQANGLGWRQGMIPMGSASAAAVARSLGFPSVCFLGPDGKVIGKSLTGGGIRAVVVGALGAARVSVAPATQPGG